MALTRTKTKTLYTPVFKPTPPTSTSSSSSSSSSYIARHHKPHSALTPNAYLNRLSRAHIGLALVEDVPSSRPGSPSDADTEVDSALKRRIVQYIQDAGGNPADGNWSLISENLKMPCTAGSNGRYMGVRRADNDGDSQTPAAVFDLLNADTEQKWFEWLKKMEVERWAGGVEVPSVDHEHSVVSNSEGTKVSAHEAPSGTTTASNGPMSVSPAVKISLAPVKGDALSREELSVAKTKPPRTATVAIVAPPLEDYDLKDPSPLGFPVVKSTSRSSLVGKPKSGIKRGAEQDKKAASNAKAPKENPEATNRQNTEPKSKSNPKPISISDVSETVFLPPSFPSHLITSTPHPDPIRVKPPPIPRASSPAQRVLSSSLSPGVPHPSTPRHNSNSNTMPPPSPSPKRSSGRSPKPNAETMSSSLPELPSSSSVIEPLSTPTRDPKKRARSSLDAGGGSEPSLKKARTMSLFAAHPQKKKVIELPSSSISDAPRTPAPAPVPAVAVDVLSSARPKRTLPTLTELLASSKKMKQQAKVKPRMQQKEDVQSRDRGGDSAMQGVRQNSEEELVLVPDHDRSRKEPEPEHSKEKEKEKPSSKPKTSIFKDQTQYSPIPGLNAHLHPSPTKSLSSIAGSDSEDSEDEQAPMFADGLGLGTAFTQDPNRFRPDLVSTQLGREKSGSVDMDLGRHSQSQSQSQTEGVGVAKGSSGTFGYNSQYDVNREVDLVSGILGKEVDLNEWLRDVSDDEDED